MIISEVQNPWRQRLLSFPASFRGIIFHVEQGSRTSGRRTVVHEYPKRNDPYAEDMGMHARRFSFSGYLIYRPSNPLYEYVSQRDRLIKGLEQNDAGILVHPVFAPGSMLVMVERYSVTESRERGGFTQFEMAFVDAGKPGNSQPGTDTAGNAQAKATDAEQQSSNDISSWPTYGVEPWPVTTTPFVPTNEESQVINSGITF